MKCKNCGKVVVKRMIGPPYRRFEVWVHAKLDVTVDQLFDPKFDLTKICMEPEPEESD